jgi:transcriptional regulator with XRE-family HTH domain
MKSKPTMSPAPKQIDESSYGGRFAGNLRRLRIKAGMTGKELAAAITEEGFDTQWRTCYGWESGERSPPMDALPAIAAALGVSIRTLFPPK